jgi:hypothetical protein
MEDGADNEVGFEVFEGFFDGDELDVVLPEAGGELRLLGWNPLRKGTLRGFATVVSSESRPATGEFRNVI